MREFHFLYLLKKQKLQWTKQEADLVRCVLNQKSTDWRVYFAVDYLSDPLLSSLRSDALEDDFDVEPDEVKRSILWLKQFALVEGKGG